MTFAKIQEETTNLVIYAFIEAKSTEMGKLEELPKTKRT